MRIRFVKTLRLYPMFLAAAFTVHSAMGQDLEPAKAGKAAPKPTNPALIDVADESGQPRVLLIGDSISIGYTLGVRQKLKGLANVHRPPENTGDTAFGLTRLDGWLGQGHWDVIHFNFGLHDLKYLDAKGNYVSPEKGTQVASPKVYGEQLRALTLRLKATGAKLVFATTTPVPVGTKGRVAGDEKAYNAVAMGVMKDLEVPVDDLCGFVVEQQMKKAPPAGPDVKHAKGNRQADGIQCHANVHFTEQGYQQLSEQVAASIQKVLPANR